MRAKLLITLASLCIFPLFASELNGSYEEGKTPRWQSVNVAAGLAPAYWDIAMRLPPAKKVVPGGGEKIGAEVLLTNGVDNVSVDIDVVGMQYQLASGCEIESNPTNTIVFVASDQLSNEVAECSNAQTPFTHFRPILKFAENDNNWKSKFKDKTTGDYVGRFNVKMLYEYYRDEVRIKHQVVFPVSVKLNFTASEITFFDVIGTGEMYLEPVSANATTISGRTIYQVTSTTSTNSGLLVSLESPESAPFHLIESSPELVATPATIPFSVICDSCDDGKGTTFIDQGVASELNAVKAPENFPLRVEFNNINQENLPNGHYQGKFTLMFEAAVL